MIDNEIKALMDEVNFEVPYDMVVPCMSTKDKEKVLHWLKKYKLNLRDKFRLINLYATYLFDGWELPEDDPRYNEDDYNTYAIKGAPEKAVKVAEMLTEFKEIEELFPRMHFTGEYMMGDDWYEKDW